MKKSKMAETAGTLERMVKFIQRVNLIAGAVVFVTSLIFLAAHRLGTVTAADTVNIELGKIFLEVTSGETMMDGRMGVYYQIMLTLRMVIAVGAVYAGSSLIRKILYPIMEEHPFDGSISVNLRKLGWLVLIYGIISNVYGIIINEINFVFYGLERLADSSYVQSVGVSYRLDVSFFLIFLVLEMVSYIFRYGAELQQLSDETL